MGGYGRGWWKSSGSLVAGAAVLLWAAAGQSLEPEGSRPLVSVRASQARVVEPSPALLVVHHGAAFAVLSTQLKKALPVSSPTVVPHPRYHVLLQRPDGNALPATIRGWTTRAVHLYRGSRLVCRATVTDLAVLTRMYRGLFNPPKDARSLVAEIERQAKLVGAQRLLVGKVTPAPGDSCAGATWARAAQRRKPAIFTPTKKIAASLRQRALVEFRKLAAYDRIQKQYRKEAEKPTARRWDGYRNSRLQVASYRASGNQRSFIVVSASAGEGCGDFYGAHWAAWEVVSDGGKGQLRLLTPDGRSREAFLPGTIVAGNGTYDFLGGDILMTAKGAAMSRQSAVVPSYLCSC